MSNIKEVFDNPRTTSRNAATLAARAGVSRKAAAAFLRDQAASQIRKRTTKPPEADYAPTGGGLGASKINELQHRIKSRRLLSRWRLNK